jgi:FHA domain
MPNIECSNVSCRQTIRVEGEWSPAYAICNVCNTPHYGPYRIIESARPVDIYKPPIPIPPQPMAGREGLTIDYYLQIFREGAPIQTAALREGKNIIGRLNCDININDKTVSKRHCVLEIRKDSRGNWQCLLYDIGYLEGTASTNGVFVDSRSERLDNRQHYIFQVGDHSQIGKTVIQLNSKSE